MHGRVPSCGFGVLVKSGEPAGHLMTGVSVHDYLALDVPALEPMGYNGAFLPLTMRVSTDLRRMSLRNSFATDVPVDTPPPLFPRGHLDGEHWLPWDAFGLLPNLERSARQQGRKLMPFDDFFWLVFGRAAPSVVCFAQGAQFAASREALRRVPRQTYEKLLSLIRDEARLEVVYYLELIWPLLLGMYDPERDRDLCEAEALETPRDRRRPVRLLQSMYYYNADPDPSPPAPPSPPASPSPPPSSPPPPQPPPARPGWEVMPSGPRRFPATPIFGAGSAVADGGVTDCSGTAATGFVGCYPTPVPRKVSPAAYWIQKGGHAAACNTVDRCQNATLDAVRSPVQRIVRGVGDLLTSVNYVLDSTRSSPTGGALASNVLFADLDADGDPDVVVSGGSLHIYENDGTGNFIDRSSTMIPSPCETASSLAVGDVDGDGDADVLVICAASAASSSSSSSTSSPSPPSGDAMVLYRNNLSPSGQFSREVACNVSVAVGGLVKKIMLGDIDGDGDLDCIFAINDRRAQWLGPTVWLNDGQGTFVASLSQLPTATSHRCAYASTSTLLSNVNDGVLADLDDDGVRARHSNPCPPLASRVTCLRICRPLRGAHSKLALAGSGPLLGSCFRLLQYIILEQWPGAVHAG